MAVLTDLPLWLRFYGMPLLLILSLYLLLRHRHARRSERIHAEALAAGLTEPASLHPSIDPDKCLGCAACVSACPEKSVLGVIQGKARLIEPSHCIGHGACRTACPFDAITLVFGTEKRGVDIPLVKPDFETNVPGIYIAGELGGMGLIRNAIRQGKEAMNAIRQRDDVGQGGDDRLDVVIVGAGPAGIAASLAALQYKLRFVTLEQESFGGTVSHYPRGKIVMTAPAELPLVGKMQFRETTKETLMAFWDSVRRQTGLEIQTGERVETVESEAQGHVVVTARHRYPTRTVLLAIGRRGTPRKLGVPGEELPKVVYRLIDPEQYRGQKVLVVGGGDSALEAALAIADEPDTTVSISYRSEAFNRAKPKNREKVEAAVAAQRLTLYMKSNVKQITATTVVLDHDGQQVELPNDAVIVNAGGILPTPFLKQIGIEVETKYGTA